MMMGANVALVGHQATHPYNVALQPGPGQDKLG
jgi:hypothetical protein